VDLPGGTVLSRPLALLVFSKRTAWNLEPGKLSVALAARRASGKPIIDLTQSNPTECGFEYDGKLILEALRDPASLRYEPLAPGLTTARSAVAEYYRSRNVPIEADDIFLTTSTSEAYSFVLRMLCNAGDELLIAQPGYPLLNFLAEICDVTLVRYPLIYDHGWQIDWHSLERAITARTRAVAVVHPNNPTGHFCKSAEMARLSEICAERELAIIADEVFLDFAIAGDQARSFASNTSALTFTMSGLSKIAGLPQMKVAWLAISGPLDLKRQAIARLEVVADTYLSMNAPVQLAVPALLGQRHHFQRQCLQRVRDNLAQLDNLLARKKLCTRLEMEGGWYAVLKVPVTGSDEDLAVELITNHGVYVHPGHFYDFPSDGYLVVSLITAEAEFSAGIAALLELFRQKYDAPSQDS
jgi:alanine-synthesizing transaminase